jgi:hypothetical protein
MRLTLPITQEAPVVDPLTGEDVSRLFHGTTANWIESITAHGLMPGYGLGEEDMLGTRPDGTPIECGVFCTPDIDEARDYGSTVFVVDISGLDYIVLDGPEGWHYVVIDPAGVPAHRVTLHW